MKLRLLFLKYYILVVCLIPQTAKTCTTFCLDKGNTLVVGSNLDYYDGDGLVFINKRNVKKTAMLLPEVVGQPASWTSKYGSITFNGAGREFPFSGMNEEGLVVAIMMLEKSEYQKPDSRPLVLSGQWNQYQLDNYATVQEVITGLSQIRIAVNSPGKLHFFVSDKMGECAVTEFIDGNMVYYTKETLPVKTLTNSTYAESISYWKKGNAPPDPFRSIWRFITSADMLKAYDPKTKGGVDYAFDILTKVSMGTVEEVDGELIKSIITTEWSIVHDIKNLRVYFRTFDNKKIRYFDLNSFDFSCKTPVKILGIQEDLVGEISDKFVNYIYKTNRELIGRTLRQPDEIKDHIAKYPETTVCLDK